MVGSETCQTIKDWIEITQEVDDILYDTSCVQIHECGHS